MHHLSLRPPLLPLQLPAAAVMTIMRMEVLWWGIDVARAGAVSVSVSESESDRLLLQLLLLLHLLPLQRQLPMWSVLGVKCLALQLQPQL